MEIPDMNTLFDIKGKVALITGASGGFGSACALGLAKAGAKVMVTGRGLDKLQPVADQINKAGGSAACVAGRPDSPEDNRKIADATVEHFGGIDILITAAGLNKVHPITEFPVEEWDEVMDINVKGTWLICKEAGRHMIKQGRGGKVVIVSSARGDLGMANYSAYSPSKGAVNLLTKSLACEWGKYGINVNAIAPTVFRTELTQWMFENNDFYKNFLARIPLGRLGEPEDFIGTVIYLCSKAAEFMTGAVLAVDGGYTAG